MEAVTVSLTPLKDGYELRVHPVGSYGDPWAWGCVLVPHGVCAELRLVQTAPTKVWREVAAELRAQGYTMVRYYRHRQWRYRQL